MRGVSENNALQHNLNAKCVSLIESVTVLQYCFGLIGHGMISQGHGRCQRSPARLLQLPHRRHSHAQGSWRSSSLLSLFSQLPAQQPRCLFGQPQAILFRDYRHQSVPLRSGCCVSQLPAQQSRRLFRQVPARQCRGTLRRAARPQLGGHLPAQHPRFVFRPVLAQKSRDSQPEAVPLQVRDRRRVWAALRRK